jgi:hypothetical protein
VVDEVEQVVVGPVQILEDEHRRPLLCQRLEELAPRREVLRAISAALELGHPDDQRPKALEHAFAEPERCDGLRQLPFRVFGRVGLEHAGLRLCHLRERPVGEAVAVGKRPTLPPVEELGVVVDDALKLQHEAALPIPGTPARVTSWVHRSSRARPSASVRKSSSRRRPTNAAPACSTSTPKRDLASRASHARTGSALPFASTGSASAWSIRCRVAR